MLRLPGGEAVEHVVGEAKGAEEAKAVTGFHASRYPRGALCRLRDDSAHEVQRRRRRPAADRLAVAGQVEVRARRSPDGPAACR